MLPLVLYDISVCNFYDVKIFSLKTGTMKTYSHKVQEPDAMDIPALLIQTIWMHLD
jgi:hypothetical protein